MPYDRLTGYVPPSNQNEEAEEESYPLITHGTRLWSLISLILAAVGLILTAVPIVGVFFGAVGVLFSAISRWKNGYFSNMAVIGLILGAVATASCVFFIIYNWLTEAGLVINFFAELIG